LRSKIRRTWRAAAAEWRAAAQGAARTGVTDARETIDVLLATRGAAWRAEEPAVAREATDCLEARAILLVCVVRVPV